MFKVRIHPKIPTKKNPQIIVAVMVGSEDDLGTFRRVFKHRGIDPTWILERPMTESEKHRVTISWRLQWYSYTNWRELIEDEWAITNNIDWINKLFKASRLPGSVDDILQNCKQ
ncbi:MAG TPA: hypothetical protein VN040_14240 [Pseudosphingobacterium sp.]|nr:hypothetical protein [Pseudosphingobacterium sp.]